MRIGNRSFPKLFLILILVRKDRVFVLVPSSIASSGRDSPNYGHFRPANGFKPFSNDLTIYEIPRMAIARLGLPIYLVTF